MQVVAAALANVVTMCLERRPAAVDKVLSHLRSFACATTAPLQPQSSLCQANLSSTSFPSFSNFPSAALPLTAHPCAVGSASEKGPKIPEVVAREGAEAALQHVVARVGAALPDRIPQLWTMVTSPVLSLAGSCKASGLQEAKAPAGGDAADAGVAASCFAVPLAGTSGELAVAVQAAAGSGPGHMREAQMAADAMQLLRCIAPALDVQLHVRLAGHVPQMMACMVHVPASMCDVVCGGMVQLTLSEPPVYLDAVVTVLLPCLEVRSEDCVTACIVNHVLEGAE